MKWMVVMTKPRYTKNTVRIRKAISSWKRLTLSPRANCSPFCFSTLAISSQLPMVRPKTSTAMAPPPALSTRKSVTENTISMAAMVIMYEKGCLLSRCSILVHSIPEIIPIMVETMNELTRSSTALMMSAVSWLMKTISEVATTITSTSVIADSRVRTILSLVDIFNAEMIGMTIAPLVPPTMDPSRRHVSRRQSVSRLSTSAVMSMEATNAMTVWTRDLLNDLTTSPKARSMPAWNMIMANAAAAT
ncbi:hypothetical protein DSECCO2_260970 [anaerobic digester metagenome]